MCRRAPTVVLMAVFLLGPTTSAGTRAPAPSGPSAEEVARAKKAVEDHLDRLKGSGAAVERIEDEAVGRAFPRSLFFSVLFRQYPVARTAPEGLKPSTVFAVGPHGKVKVLADAKDLEAYFRRVLPAARADDALKDAARAWVRLSQQFHQDGFFQFAMEDDATRAAGGKDGGTAAAKVVVMRGGNGTLTATLAFDEAGKLTTVTEEAKIRPGPRPICQATKLLDADPLVRCMAERDLLIMGRAAGPYLDEQRAKASPELRRAIDRLWGRIRAED